MATKYRVVRELKEGGLKEEVIGEFDESIDADNLAVQEIQKEENQAYNIFVHVEREDS